MSGFELGLRDKVAVVTGGAGGLGKTVCETLVNQGARVVLSDVRGDAGRNAANAVGEGDQIRFVQTDVTDPSDCGRLVGEAVDTYGRLDILINNAAIREVVGFEEIADEDWGRHISVNLTGPFYCSRAAMPYLRDSPHGRIINITSPTVRRGHPVGAAPYAASKAGLLGLTRTLAREAGSPTLTINAVSPATMRGSGMIEDSTEDEIDELANQYPSGRLPTVEEVADVVVFLASKRCSTMNGQTVEVNGGEYMS